MLWDDKKIDDRVISRAVIKQEKVRGISAFESFDHCVVRAVQDFLAEGIF